MSSEKLLLLQVRRNNKRTKKLNAAEALVTDAPAASFMRAQERAGSKAKKALRTEL